MHPVLCYFTWNFAELNEHNLKILRAIKIKNQNYFFIQTHDFVITAFFDAADVTSTAPFVLETRDVDNSFDRSQICLQTKASQRECDELWTSRRNKSSLCTRTSYAIEFCDTRVRALSKKRRVRERKGKPSVILQAQVSAQHSVDNNNAM